MSEYYQKAKQLVGQMTLEEKTAQLYSVWYTIQDNGSFTVKSLNGVVQGSSTQDPFGVLKHGMGQITRPLGSQPVSPRDGIRALNTIQTYLMTKTRLKIPALAHEECLAGLMAQGATMFPSGINNGSTWDPEMVEKVARAIGDELHSVGSRQGLAPVLDVCRDARWGRTEECFGEDPYLTGILGTAYVRGLQDANRPVLATLKHFLGHSFSEGGRNHAPVRIGHRELQDTFLLPFEMAVKNGNAGSIMPAYHDIDGEPLHQSFEYLNNLLRNRWGFEGIIVSDYEGINQLYTDHRSQSDGASTAAASLKAGVDIELPGDTVYRLGIPEALQKGLLDMSDVDEAVIRHVVQKFKLGLFKNPYVDEGLVLRDLADHATLAREAAVQSMVLLKNDGLLPLKTTGTLALIGPLADDAMGMLGGYSFPVHLIISENKERPTGLITLKQELQSRFGTSLLYSRGCDVLTGRPDKPAVFPGEIGLDGSSQTSFVSFDESMIDEAVNVARQADTVVLALGDLSGLFLSGTVGEGSDVSSLELPGVQMTLLNRILAIQKPTVVVIYSGRPYHLGDGFSRAGAVLQAWLPGQGGAAATADILLGCENPGGKMPISLPKKAGAMPYFYNHKMKSPGTPIQKDFGAEFAFGQGLSYTRFHLDSFRVHEPIVPVDDKVQLEVRVKNTGDCTGDEVIQIYFRDLFAQMVRPVMELKAFRRIRLTPGQSATLKFTIPCDMLGFIGRDGCRIVEPGDFEVMVGTSSRDILFRCRITLTGQVNVLGEEWNMVSSSEVFLGEKGQDPLNQINREVQTIGEKSH